MSLVGVPTVPPFLDRPGKPPVPWKQWRKIFENYMLAIDGTMFKPERQKAMLLHALGTEGQRIFYTLTAAAVPDTTLDVYKKALTTLEVRYAETYNVMVERRKFRQRAQLPDENVDDYVTALRGLALTCDFGTMLDEMLRDQLVDKTLLPQVRERLLLEGSTLSLDKAVQIAANVEQSRRASQQFTQEDTASVGNVSEQGGARSAKRQTPKAKTKSKTTVCYRCGSPHHLANSLDCKARRKECFKCKKMGHFGLMCKGYTRQYTDNIREVAAEIEDSSSDDGSTTVLEVRTPKKKAIYVTAQVNDKDVNFLVDTGSSVSILAWDVYQSAFGKYCPLQQASIELHDYSRKRIPVRGCTVLHVKYKTRSTPLLFYVVAQGTTLFGLDAIAALDLHIEGARLMCLETLATTSESERIARCEFSHLFTPGPGLARGYEHKVKIRSEVKPTITKLRRLPLQIRDEVSRELKKLLDMDVIEPIDASPWVSPLVVAKKKKWTYKTLRGLTCTK